jgi:hypothetical protein
MEGIVPILPHTVFVLSDDFVVSVEELSPLGCLTGVGKSKELSDFFKTSF